MQSNGVRRRKVVQYESVSETANAYRRSDPMSLGAEGSTHDSPSSAPAYRYEYEYERSSFAIFSPVSDAFTGNGIDVLAQAVGTDIAQQFTWLAETDTVRTYEHRLTRRYVHIDSITGQFCDQQRNAISTQSALSYAMPVSEVLPPRFAFASVSSLDLQIGSFVRQSILDSESDDRPSEPMRGFAKHEDTQAPGVLARIRSLLVRKFRSRESSPDTQDLASRQRAGLTLQDDHRSASTPRDDFSLAAFTRRTA